MKRTAPRRPADTELDRELAFHLDHLTQDHIARGLPPAKARRQALIDFGNPTGIKQSLRELYLSRLLDTLRSCLQAAGRSVRHAPGLSFAVLLTLALGIGANSAIFSVLDAVVLQPLPYPASQQLVILTQHNDRRQDATDFVAPARLEDWNRLNSTFQAISGSYRDDVTETSGPLPERLSMALVAPRFLTTLGVSPLLGRGFLPAEEHFGGPQAAIISYRLWQSRFHADPNVLNKVLHAGRWNMPVIGVMPPSFLYPDREVDLWTPSPPDAPYARNRDSTWFTVIGRLRPGITPQLGLANLNAIQRQLGLQFPTSDADLRIGLTPLKDSLVGQSLRSSVWLLYGSVSLLLLLACANIAALLLARTTARAHEISIRFSLGASRRFVILQLLAEVFALALVGSLLGLALAGGLVHAMHQVAADMPRTEEIALNGRVVAYSLLCAVGTAILCGLYPAVRGTRGQLATALAAGPRTQTASRTLMPWLLVGLQVALAVILLTGAGLLVRSLDQLSRIHPGFDPAHVLTFQITGSYAETTDMGALTRRIQRTLDSLQTVPGIEAAATSSATPGLPGHYPLEFRLDNHTTADHSILAEARLVSSDYFATMRIPVLQGKDCSRASSTPEFVINQSFAERHFPHSPALGHTLQPVVTYASSPGAIVGIVADAREQGLTNPPQPTVYTCFAAPGPAPLFLVRTRGRPADMVATIRRRLHELEPARSVYAVEPLDTRLAAFNTDDRLRTIVLSAFALTAILLASIGLYGTLSYMGRVRSREVGVRLALGATRAHVAGLFLLQGTRVVLAGCVLGALLSVLTGRLLATMLFGITPLDLPTYAAVLTLTLLAATLACAVPARRASQTNPTEALRAG